MAAGNVRSGKTRRAAEAYLWTVERSLACIPNRRELAQFSAQQQGGLSFPRTRLWGKKGSREIISGTTAIPGVGVSIVEREEAGSRLDTVSE